MSRDGKSVFENFMIGVNPACAIGHGVFIRNLLIHV